MTDVVLPLHKVNSVLPVAPNTGISFLFVLQRFSSIFKQSVFKRTL